MVQHEIELQAGDTLLVTGVPAAVVTPPPPTQAWKLPIPTLESPVVLTLSAGGAQTVTVPSGRDAIIRLPAGQSVRTGPVVIRGGRRVMIDGGTYEMPADLPILTSLSYVTSHPELHPKYRQFTVEDVTEAVILNDVQNHNPSGREYDFLSGYGSTRPVVYWRNVRLDELIGRYEGWHADGCQIKCAAIQMENCTIKSHYQGIYCEAAVAPINRVTTHRVNFEHLSPAESSLLWLGSTPMTATETYAKLSGHKFEGNGKIIGGVILTAPPSGDFCPLR